MQIICFRDVAFGGSAEVVAVWPGRIRRQKLPRASGPRKPR